MADLVPVFNTSLAAARRYASYNPRVQAYRKAGQAAKFAYSHRKEAAAAARSIKRAYQRYKARARKPSPVQMVGNDPGSGTTKRQNTGNIETTVRTSETLYWQDVTDIAGTPTGTSAADIDDRKRALVNLRGVKICMEWRNDTTKDLLCNVALVAPKNGDTAFTTDDFFRGHGNQRGLNFDSATLNSMDMHCRPINSDKYHVIAHKRFRMGHNDTQNPQPHKFFQHYQKINRQIRFDDEAGGTCKTPIYLVYWVARAMNTAGTPVDATCYTLTYDTVAYFREPESCCYHY